MKLSECLQYQGPGNSEFFWARRDFPGDPGRPIDYEIIDLFVLWFINTDF